MKVSDGFTEGSISLEEVGVNEPICRSVSAPGGRSADLGALVEAHLADALARGLARGTVAYRRVYLGQLLVWLERRDITQARQITPAVLDDYLAHLRKRKTDYNRPKATSLSVKTLAAEASVLRSFFRWLAARRVVLFNPAEELRLGNRTRPLPKAVLSEAEVCTLLSAPGRDTLGLRDRAILETLYPSVA
ncbi:MAG: phage integrase N-terminal SAM-like domain-containing protein [Acidobacteriota bacterium]|nr:phage integrase N-terminal SAM-like domain-containing protein [Acidobacteriota bacterium]MDQ7086439.1 phage integrase N-terminal SAM-like domain-containing protein [Acidobacteriota bacterium]